MVRREQFISSMTIWGAFTVVSVAALTTNFAGSETLLVALVGLAALASAMGTWAVSAHADRAHAAAPQPVLLPVWSPARLPRQRVERLLQTLDDDRLDELALRLVFHQGDRASLEALLREYERE